MITIPDNISQTVHNDIRELEDKIQRFKTGEMPEEKFRAYRLTRGLGAQPFFAQPIYEFLEADKIIPLTEAVIRDVSKVAIHSSLGVDMRSWKWCARRVSRRRSFRAFRVRLH